MKLFTNATIKISERNSFVNDKGETVEYGSVYLKDDEEGVLKVNTGKNDFSKHEGDQGVAIFNVRDNDGRIKITLVEFKPEAVITY